MTSVTAAQPAPHTSDTATAPILEITDLQVVHRARRQSTELVSNLSLRIAPGEVHALVGESGSGKSLTAAAIVGLLPPSIAISAGRIAFRGRDLVGLPDREFNQIRGAGIGVIFQNPATAFDPAFTIGAQLTEVARHHLGLSRRAGTAVARDWLERVGLPDERVLRAYPHELSGGMRQRAFIALVALSGPDLLIADEPTTALDASLRRRILDLILEVADAAGSGVLLITHDFGVVNHTSTTVSVMRHGQIVESGPTAQVLRNPAHEYTRVLIDSVPGAAAPTVVAATAAREPVPQTLLQLTEIGKTFPGAAGPTLSHISLPVHAGETLALIGESGSGKSTLARIAGGLSTPTTGTVEFDGHQVAPNATSREVARDFRRRFQYVFQDPATALNPRHSVLDLVTRPVRRLTGASGGAAREQARQALAHVNLDESLYQRRPHELSGGQRQRVGIARAIAVRPQVIALDEPTSALDVSTQAEIIALLRHLRDELHLTYIFIGHDLALLENIADRIAVLADGHLAEVFPATELRSAARTSTTTSLVGAALGAVPREAHVPRHLQPHVEAQP